MALRVTLPAGVEGVVHFLSFVGTRELRRTQRSFCLRKSFFRPSLLKPRLVAGDLNADPGVIPCLAKGISSGEFVDVA